MALSDFCFEFLAEFRRAADELAKGVHHYSAPDYPLSYGWEIDGLRKACADVRAEPFDPEAAARLLHLATAVMRFHDTPPGEPTFQARRAELDRLIRLLQSELDEGDAVSVPATVANVIIETDWTPDASKHMVGLLSKLSSSAYDAAIKIISDVGSATIKKMLGLP